MSDSLTEGAGPHRKTDWGNVRPRALRWAMGALAVGFFLALYGAAHYYLARRLILEPGWPDPWSGVMWISLAVVAFAILFQPVSERFFPLWVDRLVVWPAALWMGIGFFLLLALAASDFALWSFNQLGWTEGPSFARDRTWALLGVVLPLSAWALYQGLQKPGVRQVEIRLGRWPRNLDGFKIVQISDIHFGPILSDRFARWLTGRVNGLEPNLIVVTGDLVDGRVDKIGYTVEPLADLHAPCGRWFVTGNHDHYSNATDWVGCAQSLGMKVLRNTHTVIEQAGGSFVLAGVDDHRSRQMPGEGGEDLEAALTGISEALPVVLLAHDPTTFHEASRQGVDLQLSGHTHGGQIWPFHYGVRLAMPWVAGLYRRKDSTLYVSRGTGFWGPPMRLGAPAEITEITLRCGREGECPEGEADGL